MRRSFEGDKLLCVPLRPAYLLIAFLILLGYCLAIPAGAAFAFQGRVVPGDPPVGMRLLPGYSHESTAGYDSQTGRIWKEGGPDIRYDIGKWAGQHAQSLKNRGRFIWSKAQSFNGHPVHLTMEHERRLVVTFDEDHANFFVDNVKSQEDLADVLLMLMTYTPSPSPQH